MLGAAAEFERALIQERTKAGLKAARERAYFGKLNRTADQWLPIVRQMRPDHPWEDVARVLNGRRVADSALMPAWTADRLKRAVERFVRKGLADEGLVKRSPVRPVKDRLMAIIAGMARANPQLTIREIGSQLEAMRERTPRGGRRWAPSSVNNLLDRAERLGLVSPRADPVATS